MKKFLGVLVLVFLMTFVLVGCAPSEDYATKINDAAKADDYLTYKQVKSHLGKPDEENVTQSSLLGIKVTVSTWYKGAKDADDAQAKANKGKEVYSLTVTFNENDKATAAVWSKIESNESK